jgi:hypothetical protein
MIRKLVLAAAFACALGAPALAEGAKFSTATTTIGDIMANEQAKAAFVKVFPGVAEDPRLDQALTMSVAEVAGYEPSVFTEEKIKELQAEFDKIQ